MDEKNVAVLATLLKKPSEDVVKSLETEGGLQLLVSDFTTNNQVFDLDGFATLQANLKKQTIANLKEEEIPDSYKNKANGWKLEKLENEIKETYQFTDEFKGLTDLVDKIVTKAKVPQKNGEDVTALKTRITEMETDFEQRLNEKQVEFDSSIIQTETAKSIRDIDLDYEDDVLKKQKGLVRAAFNDVYKIERQDGKIVVLKGDDIVKDNKFDPLPLTDVFLSVAKDYGFQLKSPDTGGHGGQSSKKKTGLKGVSWGDYLAKNDVLPNTEAADKLYSDWKASQ